MPRKNGSGGTYHSTKQKGRSRKGSKRGTYSLMNKARTADSYLSVPPWIRKGR